MLGILLLILKIIGLILLALVALVLAVLFLVLLVPVPYRVQAEFGDTFAWQFYVFGIQVFPKKERKRRKRRERADAQGMKEELPEAGVPETGGASSDAACAPDDSGTQAAGKPPDMPAEEKPPETPAAEKPPDAGDSEKKSRRGKPEKKKKKQSGKKGVDFDGLRKKWELVRTELSDEGNHRACAHGFSEVVYILRHCGPRRVKADMAYSLGDPANTGYATAVLSMFPFVYKKGCEIVPDFTSQKLYARGRLDVRGHVRLVHFGLGGLRLLLDKDIRAIIKKVRRHG